MTDVNSLFGNLSAFATLIVGISVATERVVEIIKGAVPALTNTWTRNDQVRAGILQVIAAVTGAIIAAQMPDQVKNAVPLALGSSIRWQTYAVIGLLASGGSGAWNHALDILGALKVKQEAAASAVSVKPPAPQPPAAAAATSKP